MKTLISAALLFLSCSAQAAPALNSAHAVVFDATNQQVLLEKDAHSPAPIASITKVLTAMVALDAKPDLSETLQISSNDVDTVKHSSSRVAVGTELTREDMLRIALMSSENRAASALSRSYPGGHDAFIAAMNSKARSLGMTSTYVEDSTGLSPTNSASAYDLVRMVLAAEHYKPITEFTTSSSHTLPIGGRRLSYRNSNPLVGKPNWNIELSKTGYIKEAGRCIVMKLQAAGKDLVVVLLGSKSPSARLADIQTIKRWVTGEPVEFAKNMKSSKSELYAARQVSNKPLAGHGSKKKLVKHTGGFRTASLKVKAPIKPRIADVGMKKTSSHKALKSRERTIGGG